MGHVALTALALLLTALVMRPVADAVYTKGIEPYRKGEATAAEAWKAGTAPVKEFMVRQIERTNNAECLYALYDLAEHRDVSSHDYPRYIDECPLRVVAPAYLLSEIKTGLLIGFYLYLPFLVIDLVVSAVLMSMGMMMLPPVMISLPFKILLFVLVDGWGLIVTTLVGSY